MKKRISFLISIVLLITMLLPEPVFAANVSAKTLTEIYRYTYRYANVKTGGVALAGSSSLARWNTAGADIASYGTFTEDQVYNFGITGATFQELLDQRYINAIVRTKPCVIVVYGANSVTVSRKKASRNRTVANQATNATIKFIQKTRAALRKQGVTNTRFLFVSAVKTPYHYKTSKGKGSTCNIWKRIDTFNSRMKKYANTMSYCDYIDIEQYYYHAIPAKKNKVNLRYYLVSDKLQDTTHTAAAKALINKTAVDPLFSSDLNHPSDLAYKLVWNKVADKASHLTVS